MIKNHEDSAVEESLFRNHSKYLITTKSNPMICSHLDVTLSIFKDNGQNFVIF